MFVEVFFRCSFYKLKPAKATDFVSLYQCITGLDFHSFGPFLSFPLCSYLLRFYQISHLRLPYSPRCCHKSFPLRPPSGPHLARSGRIYFYLYLLNDSNWGFHQLWSQETADNNASPCWAMYFWHYRRLRRDIRNGAGNKGSEKRDLLAEAHDERRPRCSIYRRHCLWNRDNACTDGGSVAFLCTNESDDSADHTNIRYLWVLVVGSEDLVQRWMFWVILRRFDGIVSLKLRELRNSVNPLDVQRHIAQLMSFSIVEGKGDSRALMPQKSNDAPSSSIFQRESLRDNALSHKPS